MTSHESKVGEPLVRLWASSEFMGKHRKLIKSVYYNAVGGRHEKTYTLESITRSA